MANHILVMSTLIKVFLLLQQICKLFFKILGLILLLWLFDHSGYWLHILSLIHAQRIVNGFLCSFALIIEIGGCVLFLTLIAHIPRILHFLTMTRCDTLVLSLRVCHLLGENWDPLILPRLAYICWIHFGSNLHCGAYKTFFAIKQITTLSILVASILLTQFLVLPIHNLALTTRHIFTHCGTISYAFGNSMLHFLMAFVECGYFILDCWVLLLIARSNLWSLKWASNLVYHSLALCLIHLAITLLSAIILRIHFIFRAVTERHRNSPVLISLTSSWSTLSRVQTLLVALVATH